MKTLNFSTKSNDYEYNDILGVVYLKKNKRRYDNVVGETCKLDWYLSKYNETYFKNYLDNHGIKQLILHVTNHCNLRCRYCYFFSRTDYGKISNLVEKYIGSVGKKCLTCPVSKLCSFCFKDFLYDLLRKK